MYQDIEFDVENYTRKIGVSRLMYSSKVDLLAHRWRHPTVTIHGIEGAFSASGTKTVIPAKVIGKFSIRQVPNMDPAVVEKQVTDYLNTVFGKRKSPNRLKVTMVIGARPWLANTRHPIYKAGREAVKKECFGWSRHDPRRWHDPHRQDVRRRDAQEHHHATHWWF
ncbi:hypothetical protein AGOR_G00204720 [Albula goreensis]|uniref:Peptidase M20 dimerisation domain-containing protein n=1 Tax=Albula goreensis TaxID=1534307 RepID=A0A8T3CK51_9TELE|nr:hypothetical protein AGOR_G00204720 [Albula goreensis]